MAKVVQIPSRVTVGDYEFTLRLVPPETPGINGGENQGITYFSDGDENNPDLKWTILIVNNLSIRMKLNTVIHEITHAINFNEGVEELLDGGGNPSDIEERIAEAHGKGWARFLVDNPRYVRWLVYVLGRIKELQQKGDAGEASSATQGEETSVS